ncbi:MAG: PhoH family protein [Magnetococcales bacterium]|nr:PhoH family protein [Magnetococcales bacterium]NGZ29376.1 PhoH family protein [Magnetococcales bacterium]
MGKLLTHHMEFPNNLLAGHLYGEHDAHLKLIEEKMAVTLLPRGNRLFLSGRKDTLQLVERLLTELYELLERGEPLDRQRVEDGVQALTVNVNLADIYDQEAAIVTPLRTIYPRNGVQSQMLRAIGQNDLTIAVGPAGTGKTYLAVAAAVMAFMQDRVERIILTRPAVEAGERLGFLPGDLQAKVDPYLRPLYDALHDMLGGDRMERMVNHRSLEIAPLAYMRGRTLSNAFIILDEAQNTTPEQMKMFLTRLGHGSKTVVAGDVTQVDLPRGQPSGLVQALGILKEIESIAIVPFSEREVVRHPLVRRIVEAYQSLENIKY